jgi:hypothetical protein
MGSLKVEDVAGFGASFRRFMGSVAPVLKVLALTLPFDSILQWEEVELLGEEVECFPKLRSLDFDSYLWNEPRTLRKFEEDLLRLSPVLEELRLRTSRCSDEDHLLRLLPPSLKHLEVSRELRGSACDLIGSATLPNLTSLTLVTHDLTLPANDFYRIFSLVSQSS